MIKLRHFQRAGAVAAFCAATLASFTTQAAYVLTEFARAGATTTALFDVNNAGAMVGYSIAGSGPTAFTQGFVYSGGSFTTLGGPAGAVQSAALGISDGGTVVGSWSFAVGTDAAGNPVLSPQRGFIYSGGSYTSFEVAGATDTFLRAISPDGRYYSGYYSTATQAGVGFVYDSLLGALATVSVPGSLFTIAQGINSSGVLVGSDLIGPPPGTRPGFFYDIATATRTDATIAGAQRTALRTIDDAGVVGGWFMDTSGDTHGFVGSVASFEQIDFAGADATFVQGSNNAGLLVGQFNAGGRSGAFIASKVPEPASSMLVLAALGALAALGGPGRRRRPLPARA